MNTSVEINELATALAKAQAEMEGATKASANPYFKSKYADLASVRDACMGPLTKYGIAVVQSPSAEGAVVSVETTFLHTSGQWVSGIASATAKDDSPQSVGSAITYLRRYALQSFSGVAPEDDDGEAAQGRGNGKTAAAVAVVVPPGAPAGYDAWLISFAASAKEGIEALRVAYKAASPEHRDYLRLTEPDRLERMTKAAKAIEEKAIDQVVAAALPAFAPQPIPRIKF